MDVQVQRAASHLGEPRLDMHCGGRCCAGGHGAVTLAERPQGERGTWASPRRAPKRHPRSKKGQRKRDHNNGEGGATRKPGKGRCPGRGGLRARTFQEGEANEVPLGLTIRTSVNEDSWR